MKRIILSTIKGKVLEVTPTDFAFLHILDEVEAEDLVQEVLYFDKPANMDIQVGDPVEIQIVAVFPMDQMARDIEQFIVEDIEDLPDGELKEEED